MRTIKRPASLGKLLLLLLLLLVLVLGELLGELDPLLPTSILKILGEVQP